MSKASDLELLNAVANTPEVLAGAAPGYADLDLSAFLDAANSAMIGSRKGLVLFAEVSPCYYEMHYLLTNQLKGRERLQLIKDAIWQVFTYRECYVIVGATPRENRAARAINRALGGLPIGAKVDTLGRDCIIYKLERVKWAHLLGA